MGSITLEEVKKAKSFAELKDKYIPRIIFTLEEKNKQGKEKIKNIYYTRVCASSIYYQIYHYYKKKEYGRKYYIVDGDCKGPQCCGNYHIDVRKFNKISYCRPYLVNGKCQYGVDCKYLHIFDDTKYTTLPPISPPISPLISPPILPPISPPILPPILPPISPPILPPILPPTSYPILPPILPPTSHPILPPILDYKPPPIEVPTFSECQECTNFESTSETQGLNTNSSTSESHQFSYSLVDYWKGWAKFTTEKIQYECQLIINNNYSEYQIEIMKLKSKLENELDKAARDREYYKERLEFYQKQINKNFSNDKYDKYDYERDYEKKRQRYY